MILTQGFSLNQMTPVVGVSYEIKHVLLKYLSKMWNFERFLDNFKAAIFDSVVNIKFQHL